MRRAKNLIVRGLLTRGTDGRSINRERDIIGGIYNDKGYSEGRIFIIENSEKATLVWKGNSGDFRKKYMKIRDELCGQVPYRKYGRAAVIGSAPGEAHFTPITLAEIGIKENVRNIEQFKSIELDIREKEFEDILAKYTELIEKGLTLEGRQKNVAGKAIDLFFKDEHGDYLIVEVKRGIIKREHIAQLLDYEGYFVNKLKTTVRVMLVGNYIPSNFKNSLDHHGIEYRAYSLETLKSFLLAQNDIEVLKSLKWL